MNRPFAAALVEALKFLQSSRQWSASSVAEDGFETTMPRVLRLRSRSWLPNYWSSKYKRLLPIKSMNQLIFSPTLITRLSFHWRCGCLSSSVSTPEACKSCSSIDAVVCDVTIHLTTIWILAYEEGLSKVHGWQSVNHLFVADNDMDLRFSIKAKYMILCRKKLHY